MAKGQFGGKGKSKKEATKALKRKAEAEEETQTRRPDMWQRYIDRQQLHKGKR